MQNRNRRAKWEDKTMQSIIIRDKDREKLREYIPNIDELIKQGDLLELQLAMMEAIDVTLDKDDEATDETIVLERIYDRVSYETKMRKLENKYDE